MDIKSTVNPADALHPKLLSNAEATSFSPDTINDISARILRISSVTRRTLLFLYTLTAVLAYGTVCLYCITWFYAGVGDLNVFRQHYRQYWQNITTVLPTLDFHC